MRVITAVLASLLVLEGAALAENVELENGDKLKDVIVLEQNDEVWVLQHPVLGRIEVPASQVKPPEPPKAAETRPGIFGTSVLAGWVKAFSLGFSGSSGVTDETNFNTDLQLKNETERHRDAFVASYFFAEKDGDKTNNEFNLRHLHDFLIKDSRWFGFLSGGYKYDEFQSWDHRITGGGGVGYDFIKNDVHTLTGRIGPGFTVTRGGDRFNDDDPPVRIGPDDREDFNGIASLTGSWAITEGVSFNAEAAYIPVLSDMPEFRAISLAELKVAIGIIKGLGVKVGGSYEYDSQNAERNDRKYYGNIVYDF